MIREFLVLMLNALARYNMSCILFFHSGPISSPINGVATGLYDKGQGRQGGKSELEKSYGALRYQVAISRRAAPVTRETRTRNGSITPRLLQKNLYLRLIWSFGANMNLPHGVTRLADTSVLKRSTLLAISDPSNLYIYSSYHLLFIQLCKIISWLLLTPSTFSLISRPAAPRRARRIDVAVPVCLDATRWTAVCCLGYAQYINMKFFLFVNVY